MRLAMKLPPKGSGASAAAANDVDPREGADLDVIDLASRNAYPVVAGKKGKMDGMGMAAGIALVAGLGLVTLWSMSSARMEQPAPQAGAAAPANPVVTPAPPVVLQPGPQVAPPPPTNLVDPAPSPVYAAPPAAGPAPQPVTNPNSSPTVVFDAGGTPVAATPAEAAALAAATGNSPNDFASRVGGVGGAAARASAMTNPGTTVTQGTLIPAVLETAIDTNVPGYVRAVVSQDVRSFDGTRVLVPRSSRLIGQYQSGLQNGQRRAYVIWTRLIRPDGASVNLASPGIGFDGTTGLAGQVSGNSFFKRFGSAMLLSVVGGLGGLASGGASVILGGAGQTAASTAAQQDGQRGPTVRVRQGEPIRIFTARDLDFSGVS
ncbi:TrbI/VirB10 family protein [Qipengyuania sediminis]|uniref:TrbI/VirB10 family protein n=1 Tax=Qipengyuania sediminis TaxID=1532023 RepID=UPI001F0D4135|nr:TrbI/VirB10 family protein [Qipengyuania sediminis]